MSENLVTISEIILLPDCPCSDTCIEWIIDIQVFYDDNQSSRNKIQCKNEGTQVPLANLVDFKL